MLCLFVWSLSTIITFISGCETHDGFMWPNVLHNICKQSIDFITWKTQEYSILISYAPTKWMTHRQSSNKQTNLSKLCHDRMQIGINQMFSCHDDVIKWKHFPRNWPFVRGIHRSLTKASDAELWCLFFFLFFFYLRLNKRLSKQSWGGWFDTLSCPLWRHCNASAWIHSQNFMFIYTRI